MHTVTLVIHRSNEHFRVFRCITWMVRHRRWRREFRCHANAKYPDLIVQSRLSRTASCSSVPQSWPKESAAVYKHMLQLYARKGRNEHPAIWNGLDRSWGLWLQQVSLHTRHMCILDVSVCQWLGGVAMQGRVEVQGVSVDISVCFSNLMLRGLLG